MRARHALPGATIGLSAFLLFSVEPLSSKELLARMGGSSSVWLSCLCFFQSMLLVGYGYAVVLTGATAQRVAKWCHVTLLVLACGWSLSTLPGLPVGADEGASHPTRTIFKLLFLRLGLPFFLLSATSPLLQVWLARKTAVSFRLFALSNAGSLLALLAYPSLIEPHLTLDVQRSLWTAGFFLYAVLCGWLTLGTLKDHASADLTLGTGEPAAFEKRSHALCFLLSVAGAIQLCAVTAHLTENVAALPLLWVVPLGAYLFSFVLAFEVPWLYRRDLVLRFVVVFLASLGYLLSKTDVSLPLGLSVGIFLTELFLACWFCHAEIYRLRPLRRAETARFYLVLSAGGATGTALSVLIAPLLFNANYDLPLAFACTAGVAMLVTWQEGWSRRLLWGTSAVLCLVLTTRLRSAYERDSLLLTRNFYGSVRVKHSDLPVQAEGSRLLLHGTIEHGMQWFAPGFRTEPLTYYGRTSGVGLALSRCCEGRPRHIGVIGLGAGTLAAYGRSGDSIRFYEINPAMEQIASELFTYERESKATVTVVSGDARRSLEGETGADLDVLVVDAFSGDAIPVHLLTVEALRLYRKRMKPDGILAFHISNQYVDLAPVLSALSRELGLQGRVIDSGADASKGIFAARWVLLAPASASVFAAPDGWLEKPLPTTELRAWTDDYSSLLPLMRWGGNGR